MGNAEKKNIVCIGEENRIQPTYCLWSELEPGKAGWGLFFYSNYICDWVMILTQKAFKCKSNFSRTFEKDIKDKYCLEKKNLLKYFLA